MAGEGVERERPGGSAYVAAAGFAAVLAGLYFARAILIPFALALLFAFVLAPIIVKLQRVGLSRVTSVLVVVILTGSLIMCGGWLIASQFIQLAKQLPGYKSNIDSKLSALRSSRGGTVASLLNSIQDISLELSPPPPASSRETPLPVRVVEPPHNLVQYARDFAGPLLRPIETAFIVLIFTIFMLLERVSVRNRLLRLIGQGRLSHATKALSDAAERVSRFLLMQLIVNLSFGALFGIGLWLIGLPNAPLFGAFAAILRFIPYVGSLSAAAMPLILSIAVFNNWTGPLLVLGLFLVLELLVANVIEPWLYGAHTGLSSLAILVAAVFWTSIWGPAGLILSTPLTVCLVVIGKHVPHLQFLNILLGDDPVLLPAEQYYQRLLALDVDEARTIVDQALKNQPLVEVYDQIVIAALSMAEHDRFRSDLRDITMDFICQSTGDIVEELGSATAGESANRVRPEGSRRVMCFGAYDAADEVTAAMLAQVLDRKGHIAIPFPLNPAPVQVLEMFSPDADDIVCICALPPLAVMHARSVTRDIRAKFPGAASLVCLWGTAEGHVERMQRAVPENIVRSLGEAVAHIELSLSVKSGPGEADESSRRADSVIE